MKKVLSLTNINTNLNTLIHHDICTVKKSISANALPIHFDYIKQPIEIVGITHSSINKFNKCFVKNNNFPNEILNNDFLNCIVSPNELASETEKIEAINLDDIFTLNDEDDIKLDESILCKKILKFKKRKV
jgi:hypothetical protein